MYVWMKPLYMDFLLNCWICWLYICWIWTFDLVYICVGWSYPYGRDMYACWKYFQMNIYIYIYLWNWLNLRKNRINKGNTCTLPSASGRQSCHVAATYATWGGTWAGLFGHFAFCQQTAKAGVLCRLLADGKGHALALADVSWPTAKIR